MYLIDLNKTYEDEGSILYYYGTAFSEENEEYFVVSTFDTKKPLIFPDKPFRTSFKLVKDLSKYVAVPKQIIVGKSQIIKTAFFLSKEGTVLFYKKDDPFGYIGNIEVPEHICSIYKNIGALLNCASIGVISMGAAVTYSLDPAFFTFPFPKSL